jgi:hypothetical protein
MPMKDVISGGYWQATFQYNSRPMQTDETFVKANFPDAYISELMRMKKGFVDIPVGSFKVSHLSEHHRLHVHCAPRVCFSQTAHQHKRRRVHLLISAELRIFITRGSDRKRLGK